jgi:hypothetical protein
MKRILGVVVLSIILSLLNQGYGQPNWPILYETHDEIIMQNSWVVVKLSKNTGGISSFIYWNSETAMELLTDTGYITIRDKRDTVEYRQSAGEVANIDTSSYPPDSVRAVFDINFGLPPPAEYPYSIRIIYTLGVQAFHWDAELQTDLTPDREANIDFSIPVIANMDYAFWTKDGAPFKLPITRTVRYRKLWDVWTVVPTIILFNDTSNVGLSFVSPFELRKPGLDWKIKSDSFIISNYYLRLSNNHPCSAAVYIVPHEADWRPGLAWIYDKYPDYFNPVSQTVLDGEGWYTQCGVVIPDSEMAKDSSRGVTWAEFGGIPFLGLYAPAKNSWMIITDKDDSITYDMWNNDESIPGVSWTSHDTINAVISRWDNHGIQTYIYFESFESWKEYTNRFFPGQFATDADKETPLPAWKYCYLMNPDPDGLWGEHIVRQIDSLLIKYPNVNGIFYDRDDYCDYDYNHSDGVTMIGPDSAYMLGFALEKMNKIILDTVHNHGKGVWTNGPTSVEVCKDMDGIMSEAPYQAPCLQYLGINRPLIYLPYDTIPQQTEEKLKTALWTGHFPSIAWWYRAKPECWGIDSNYRPLFSLYKGKKWVLYPHALQLPEGIKGNIFQTPAPNSDYLVAMIDPERYSSKIYPETTHDIFRYDRLAKVQVPGNNEIKYCYLLSGDYRGVNQDSIHRNPAQARIEITPAAHRVSSLIQLSKEPMYEITRTSSPVLTRGDSGKFEVKVHNLSSEGEKSYDILLVTPFGEESFPFSLPPERCTIIGMSFEVDTHHPLGEDTMKVIERIRDSTVVFTSWIVDLLTFQLPEKLFIHSGKCGDTLAGDTIPFILVNNTERTLNVTLKGSLMQGSDSIRFGTAPYQLTRDVVLNPLEDTGLLVYIAPEREVDTVKILAIVSAENDTVYAIRPVERSMDTLEALFYDDFSSGSMDKWDTTFGIWVVDTISGVAKGSGPMHMALKYDTNEPEPWTDFEFQVNTKLGSSAKPWVDWIKSFIYFRVQNESTYYRFGIAQGFKAISLFKRVNDNWSLLSSCDFNVKKDVWYNLRVEVGGAEGQNNIKCFLDGNLVINVTDTDTILTSVRGGIGIGVTEDDYVNYYDDVVVRRISR